MTLRRLPALLTALAAAALAACTTVPFDQLQAPTAKPDPAKGYVAAQVTREDWTTGYAVVLRNQQNDQKILVPLGRSQKGVTEGTKEQVQLQAVPPGRYAVEQWYTYAGLTGEYNEKRANKVSWPVLTTPFEVAPGQVVFLAKWDLKTTRTPSGYNQTLINYLMQPRPITAAEAKTAVAESHVGWAESPFECLGCSDTRAKPVANPLMGPDGKIDPAKLREFLDRMGLRPKAPAPGASDAPAPAAPAPATPAAPATPGSAS